jgi:NAD(P)-dependent dehydrogenase (short-subunit alcohol dehydrogenase family)
MENADKLFSVKGKVIAIIGATGILGRQYTEFLSSEGANLAIGDINKEACIELAGKMKEKYGTDLLAYHIDISDENQIEGFFKELINKFGKLDVLINNVQTKPEGFYAPFESYRKETLSKVLDANLGGSVISSQKACLIFLKQGYGNIINISSTYGNIGADQRLYEGVKNIYFPDSPFSSPVSYAITKAGMINLTRYLASYFREKNIRVNCLTPGGVFDNHDDTFVRNYAYRTILGRMADKNEYNGAILFLASDASSYMTGSNLIVDGGWTAI